MLDLSAFDGLSLELLLDAVRMAEDPRSASTSATCSGARLAADDAGAFSCTHGSTALRGVLHSCSVDS